MAWWWESDSLPPSPLWSQESLLFREHRFLLSTRLSLAPTSSPFTTSTTTPANVNSDDDDNNNNNNNNKTTSDHQHDEIMISKNTSNSNSTKDTPTNDSATATAALIAGVVEVDMVVVSKDENANFTVPTATTAATATATATATAFEISAYNRYACKQYARFEEEEEEVSEPDTTTTTTTTLSMKNTTTTTTTTTTTATAPTTTTASVGNPWVIQTALRCLQTALLTTPSGFNTQPYRVVLVHDAHVKEALAAACLGPNAQRIRDSDCTAIFLADKQICKTFPRHVQWLRADNERRRKGRSTTPLSRKFLLRTLFYITLFSSGYPLPRFLAAPLSFAVRTTMAILNWFSVRLFRYPLPTLTSAETWASKHASMVAMSYMLACSANNVQTTPMEGINAAGIRKVLGIRNHYRYAIPLIVATGIDRRKINNNRNSNNNETVNDKVQQQQQEQQLLRLQEEHLHRRYSLDELLFENSFATAAAAATP